jgi:hypothetical protein
VVTMCAKWGNAVKITLGDLVLRHDRLAIGDRIRVCNWLLSYIIESQNTEAVAPHKNYSLFEYSVSSSALEDQERLS